MTRQCRQSRAPRRVCVRMQLSTDSGWHAGKKKHAPLSREVVVIQIETSVGGARG